MVTTKLSSLCDAGHTRRIWFEGSQHCSSPGIRTVDLRWEQVDLKGGVPYARGVKLGTPTTHPLTGRELPRPAIFSGLFEMRERTRSFCRRSSRQSKIRRRPLPLALQVEHSDVEWPFWNKPFF